MNILTVNCMVRSFKAVRVFKFNEVIAVNIETAVFG